MTRDGDCFKRLFVGEDRRLVGATVLIASALIIVASVVEYLVLTREIAGGYTPALLYVRETFRLVPIGESRTVPMMWVHGYVLVVALAAIPAYFNAGYLTSVLLAVSPNVGIALWSIHGLDEYVGLTPVLVFDRVLPEGPLVATLGFLLGLGLRKVMRAQTASRTRKSEASEP